jgi:putative hemolysin
MILTAFITVGFSLLCMAFFAGSEMAIISCNRIKMRHKAERGERRARIVLRFLEHPEKFLGTTLVGYNLAIIIGSCVLNSALSQYAPAGTENIFSLIILWPLVLIGGQITPMASGRQNANKLSLMVARPLSIAYYILFPLVFSASMLARRIFRLITGGRSTKNPFVTREELELLVKEGHESGFLKKEEREIIEEIFDFGETTVREAMVPLIDVVAGPETATVEDVDTLIAKSGHSRIPIYRRRVDDIIGTVSATDLTGVPGTTAVGEVMRSPYIIPESASLEIVLRDLQRNRKHIAIVVDEYGGVSGILTLEDIIEEIVGEIEDEYDMSRPAEWHKRPESIVVEGKMRVEEFNEEFGQRIPSEGAETMAGFVINRLGQIPRTGDELRFGRLHFRVIEATDRRVVSIEIKNIETDERAHGSPVGENL